MPALTPVVESLDKIPEAARPFYEQKDGKFHLALDSAPAGFVPAADLAAANGRVVEFRDNNIKLVKEVDELRPKVKAFEGLDPTTVRTQLTELDEIKKKGITKPDDITAQIKFAVDAAITPLKEQLTASQTTIETERKRADSSLLRTVIGESFIKAGGVPSALDFIVTKAASEAFEVKEGRVVAKSNKFSTANPGNPLDVTEWLTGETKVSDFAFKPSAGGGAAGGLGGGGVGGDGLRAGQTWLTDPTPQQLGENAKDIKAGKVKVRYTTTQ